MEEDARDVAGWLAALANVPMTRERIAALARVLPPLRATALALSAVEYHEGEPACRFRPPRGALS